MIIYQLLYTFAFLIIAQTAFGETPSYPKYIKTGEPISVEAYEYYKNNPYSTYFIDPKHIPKVQNNTDGSIEIIYSGGRSITLGQKLSFQSDMEIPGKINEITCLPLELRTRCKAKTDLMMKDYRLIWKSHPNSEKVGRTVRVKAPSFEGSGEAPINRTFFGTYEAQFMRFAPATMITEEEWQRLEPSHLQCDSYEWYENLTQTFSDNSKDLRLNEWSQENMNDNPETQLSENRTSTAHLGVKLVKTESGLEIENIEFPGMSESSNLFLFFGDVIGWNTVKGPQTCNLAFNFDSASFIAQFRLAQSKIEEEPLDVVFFKSEDDFNFITAQNQFNVTNLENTIGSNNEFKNLALLGLMDTNFTHQEIMADVIMVDGSIASMPLSAYKIEVKEPVE